MRRADEAMGNLLEQVRQDFLPCTIVGGALAGDIPEDATEGTKAAPSCLEREVDHGKIGVAQQCPGTLDPAGQQIAMRRQAERRLERSGKMRRRDAADRGKSLHRPSLMRCCIHGVLGAQQPAQQRRPPHRICFCHGQGLHRGRLYATATIGWCDQLDAGPSRQSRPARADRSAAAAQSCDPSRSRCCHSACSQGKLDLIFLY